MFLPTFLKSTRGKGNQTNKQAAAERTEVQAKTKAAKQQEAAETHALLESLAKQAEVELLAKADSFFEECVAEHKQDRDGYTFECSRFGDYLEMSIARLGNVEIERYRTSKKDRTLSTAIRIEAANVVRLIEGHAPDRKGNVEYLFNLHGDREGNKNMMAEDMGNIRAPENLRYVVRSKPPTLRYDWPLFHKIIEGRKYCSGDSGWWPYGYRIQHETLNYPRPAEDDVVYFEDIDARLFIPAGMGRSVYESILTATDRLAGSCDC